MPHPLGKIKPVDAPYLEGAPLPSVPNWPGIAVIAKAMPLGERPMANGLTPRQDAMAVWVSLGSSLSEAYRATHGIAMLDSTANSRASEIAALDVFKVRVGEQVQKREDMGQYKSVSMRDFVINGLTKIAELDDAPMASRVRCLELLGKTEALFTDVKRVEHSTGDMSGLKAQLEQRLRLFLRQGSVSVPSLGVDSVPVLDSRAAIDTHYQPIETHPMPGPPFAGGGPARDLITKAVKQSVDLGPHSLHRDMQEGDL